MVSHPPENDHIVTLFPIHRGGDFVLRDDCISRDPQHFIEVAAGTHGVAEHQFVFLVGTDHGTLRTVALLAAVRPSGSMPASAGSMS